MKACHGFAGALVAAALVATVVVATGSATRGGSSVRTQTLTLIEGAEASFSFVDNDPESSRSVDSKEGPEISAGDVFTIATELLTKTKKHAGWLHATCTATVGADDFDHSRFTCTGRSTSKEARSPSARSPTFAGG